MDQKYKQTDQFDYLEFLYQEDEEKLLTKRISPEYGAKLQTWFSSNDSMKFLLVRESNFLAKNPRILFGLLGHILKNLAYIVKFRDSEKQGPINRPQRKKGYSDKGSLGLPHVFKYKEEDKSELVRIYLKKRKDRKYIESIIASFREGGIT